MMRLVSGRGVLALATSLALSLSLVTLASQSPVAAASLPTPYTLCQKPDFNKTYLVRKVSDAKGTLATLVLDKAKANGQLVCRSMDWATEATGVAPAAFGTWVYEPLHKQLIGYEPSLKPLTFTGELADDPCRLQWTSTSGLVHTTSMAWTRERSVITTMPTSRPIRGLLVHTYDAVTGENPPSRADVDAFNSTFRSAITAAQDYWLAQSRGKFTINIDVAPGIYGMEYNPQAGYVYKKSQSVSSLDDEIDFRGYDFIVTASTARAGGAVIFLSPVPVMDGAKIPVLLEIGRANPEAGQLTYLLEHEIAHTFGLPDYYADEANSFETRFVGDSMLLGKGSRYLTGYERWILGWIPDQRVKCVTQKGQGSATITGVDSSAVSDALVIFPLGPSAALVVENRSRSLPASLPEGQHLFVYLVNAKSRSALSAGTGAESSSIYSRIGQGPSALTSTPAHLEHQAEPPMVTFRQNQASLRRISDAPAAGGSAYADWYRANNLAAINGQISVDAYLSPSRTNAISTPWFGLAIPTPPATSTDSTGQPALTFNWNFTS